MFWMRKINLDAASLPSVSPSNPKQIPPAPTFQKYQQTPLQLSTSVGLLLILILAVFAIAPLLYPGYIQTHNGFVPLWNVLDLRANLGNLSWLPLRATNFDPLRSDGLLPYYLTSLLPFSPEIAIKLLVGISWVGGGIGIFLWLRSWLGNVGALVSALLYIYLPYQIVTLYVRGAFGELLFWGLLPWGILASTFLVTSPRWILLPLAALFWAGMGLSQLGLTFFALIFIIGLLLTVHRPQAIRPILSALSGTLLAVIVYLLLPPHSLWAVTSTPFSHHFLYPFQLVSAYWGFGSSRAGFDDGLSLQIGLVALGLTILTLYLWQRGRSDNLIEPQVSRTDRRLMFFVVAPLILILLQFSITTFIWNLPIRTGQTLADTLTYPWQLLGFIGLCLSVLGGAALWLDQQLTRLPLLGAIIMLIILSVYSYLGPQFVQLEVATIKAPQAELGETQLALLDADFAVLTSGYTVGLEQGPSAIPLTLYGPIQGDDTLLLNVTWQPLQIFDQDLKVFVHLIDSGENVLAQFDGQPQEGVYPTSQWIPGELIKDTYPLHFPATASAGPYRVFIGLYNETTGQRLPVPTDFAGRVILDVK